MAAMRDDIIATLARITLPGGGDAVSRDLIRALTVEGGLVRFVIEAATPEEARSLSAAQPVMEAALRAMPVSPLSTCFIFAAFMNSSTSTIPALRKPSNKPRA